MLRLLSILLLFCFLISIVCVPEGDFSLLTQLPALYQHCKETEDTDMNLPDFVINHLINIESISAKHLEGNDKPHQPFRFQHIQHLIAFVTVNLNMHIVSPATQLKKLKLLITNRLHSDYMAYIFHPPNLYNYKTA